MRYPAGGSEITRTRPSPEEVRTQLNLVLAGSTLSHAPKLASFLRFVVEAALAGGANRLKDYTIAVGALGRRLDFDPQTDAIVRVDAIRVRRALARYYAIEGARDPILIELPRRSYAPTFSRREPIPVPLRARQLRGVAS
jgi:hypothetical protein